MCAVEVGLVGRSGVQFGKHTKFIPAAPEGYATLPGAGQMGLALASRTHIYAFALQPSLRSVLEKYLTDTYTLAAVESGQMAQSLSHS